ncbi:MAG: anthranilate phosphoribosyltransferase [Bacteroidota bacterium]
MKKILTRLFNHERLTKEEAKNILFDISKEQYNDCELAAFMTVFQMRPIAVQELDGFREALLELCKRVDLGGEASIDIVGTGGDGKNTFNISTLSCFLVAGAGYKVTKHGNYGVSSVSGSSNVLQQLGYSFSNDTDTLRTQLDRANICFFHAPFFHPAMKAVGPARKAMRVKTFFNMLGPLVNPAQPKYNLLGVFSLELARLYQYILQQTERQFAIVYALDGYDEISLTGNARVYTNQSGQLISPEDLGKQTLQPSDLFGGDTVEEAASIFYNILDGKGTKAQQDVVIANAGLAIQRFKPQQSIIDCMAEAEESLLSKRALEKLQKLVN